MLSSPGPGEVRAMDAGAQIIVTLSGLVLVALGAAAAGERVGAPLLLIFLAVGVLAGPEGPGRLVIEDPNLAFTGASAALAVILLDGGLRTRPDTLAQGLRPGLALAVAGTIATAVLTGLAAMAAFGFAWREALLIGAIVSSTDAAAVFAVIGAGAKVRDHVAATLETESGLNDPTAVFLTLSLAGALAAGESAGPLTLVGSFAWQTVGGGALGAGAGWALARAAPRLRLAAGLRPILILAGGLFAFSAAQALHASGFLAAYVCGVVLARRDRGVVETEARALDGFAWLAQLGLFLTLGLLATPSHIAVVAGPALAVALTLTFVARPLATLATLAPFRFSLNERLFAAWAGLRGATPIFLGLAPAALGAPNANLYFSVAFVVVGVSLVAQGWTTPFAARLLGVTDTDDADRPAPVEIGWTRGLAVGAALVAAASVAVTVARVAAPVAAPTWTPLTVAELEAGLPRAAETPVTTLPEDWLDITDTERRKRLFAGVVGPLAETENRRIAAERAEIEAFRDAEARGETLSLAAQGRRDVLARAYDGDYDDLDDLLARIDGVPPRLAVAQAALTTGWGTSTAALEANALFGRRPDENSDGDEEGARRFRDLEASVADYMRALNTLPDFAEFRRVRAAARAAGGVASAEELAPFIAPFASDGPVFAGAVLRTIETLPGAAPAVSTDRP